MRKMTEEELAAYKEELDKKLASNMKNYYLDFAILCVSQFKELYPNSFLIKETIKTLNELKE